MTFDAYEVAYPVNPIPRFLDLLISVPVIGFEGEDDSLY